MNRPPKRHTDPTPYEERQATIGKLTLEAEGYLAQACHDIEIAECHLRIYGEYVPTEFPEEESEDGSNGLRWAERFNTDLMQKLARELHADFDKAFFDHHAN